MSQSSNVNITANAPGGWLSPISAAAVAAGAVRLGQPAYGSNGLDLYFLEGRPTEGGRQVLVRYAEGKFSDVSAADVNVRSLAHEYGGGAYVVGDGLIFYSNYADQRVYVMLESALPDTAASALPLSPAGPYRFADYFVDFKNKRLLCVLEDHSPVEAGQANEPANKIVALSYKNAAAQMAVVGVATAAPNEISDQSSQANGTAEIEILLEGSDFYAYPRLNADGDMLAYMRWQHPNLPWDDSVLAVSLLDGAGRPRSEVVVAGGEDCSVFQPQWCADKLYFVSDQSGFWNLFCCDNLDSAVDAPAAKFKACLTNITPRPFRQCEFGQPLWNFAQSTYVVVNNQLLICAVNRRGLWHLAALVPHLSAQALNSESEKEAVLTEISSSFSEFSGLALGAGKVAMLAAAADQAGAVVEYDLSSGTFSSRRSSVQTVPDSAYMARPEVIEFPTEGGRSAFAFFYAPVNADYQTAADKKVLPPLLVKCHGGPTGAASSALSLSIQFWASRGFAVVDVNYGGSTGYGRDYRKRLNDNWGIVDVDDCVNVVKYLVAAGQVDGERVAITGGSAGGFTVLCGLTFKDVFKAGASHYGIGDLEALLRDTHKFEARYLDNLVGPYPAGAAIYKERSPINHVEKLQCPVIFFQGLEDKVVPPNQAEAMVEALCAKNIPVAYIAYEGEQHGFRQAANIIRTLEAELYFYRRIFGIESAEKLPLVEIRNENAGEKSV